MSEKKNDGFDLKTLIFMGTGSVIGAGVVSYVGIAVGYTGRATWIAYLLAILLGFLANLPLILMTTAARIKGGNYSFMATTLGDLWGGYYGIASVLTVLAFSNFALALGAYLNIAFPAIPAKVWAYAGITLFLIINMFGTNFMAKVENWLSVILIFGLLLLGFYGIANALPDAFNISQPGYFLNGKDGFYQAVMALMASTTGYALITAFSGQCKNPKKDLPLSLCIVPLILVVIYGSVGFAMSNVLPVEETANKTLVAVASQLFNPVVTTIFVFAGPVMALATTLNSSFGIFERPLLVITKDGWLPEKLATQNKYGVAWKYMLIIFCIGIIPMTLGLSIATILGNITFVMSMNNILLIIGIMRYPQTMEGAWENRAWKYSKGFFYTACFIALAIQCFLIWRSFRTANMGMIIGSVIALVVIMGWCYYRMKSGKVHVTKSWELQ
jgi:amino acid transporter